MDKSIKELLLRMAGGDIETVDFIDLDEVSNKSAQRVDPEVHGSVLLDLYASHAVHTRFVPGVIVQQKDGMNNINLTSGLAVFLRYLKEPVYAPETGTPFYHMPMDAEFGARFTAPGGAISGFQTYIDDSRRYQNYRGKLVGREGDGPHGEKLVENTTQAMPRDFDVPAPHIILETTEVGSSPVQMPGAQVPAQNQRMANIVHALEDLLRLPVFRSAFSLGLGPYHRESVGIAGNVYTALDEEVPDWIVEDMLAHLRINARASTPVLRGELCRALNILRERNYGDRQ